MNTKLATITTQYSKFSDNQVLTKGQLNEFLDYFEDQDHLSRIGLSGVGIVCGFHIAYNASLKEIKISKGYGVTTDGDLLALVEPQKPSEGEPLNRGLQLIKEAFKTYTHYRVFDDSNAKYTPFFYNEEEQIDLLEIFPGEDIDTTNTSYTNLKELSQTLLDDKVVLLYLENYPKQGDLCTALDCDNQGIEQIARLRVLLVSSDDARTITGYDAIYNEHDWNEYYLALPEIVVKRDILTCANTKEYTVLKENYYNLIKDNETLADLGLGLDAILEKFNKPSISSSISTLFDISPYAVSPDIQYRYDLLKDLVSTYTEIKELLLHINVHCCPSIGSFPKHLLLGRLKENQAYYKSLRHRFYKSPIIGHEDDNLQRVQHLLNRALLLVNNYLEEEKGEDIKITPSQAYGFLSNKAIPFYYNVSDNLLDHWSHDKHKNYAQKTNLSYHTGNLSTSPTIKEPLLYTIDNYNFLRIEGIQGKSYQDALDQVLQLKEDYGLNFDVKTLSINATTKSIDLADYRCEFEDLNVLLKAWTTEQECILASMASFFSGFSTDKVGVNIKEIEYTQVISIADAEVEIALPIHETIAIDAIERPKSKITSDKKTDKENIFGRNSKKRSTYKKNVIDNSLADEEKTIGPVMKRVFEENKKGSVNDIKNAAKSKIQALLSTNEWLAKPTVRDFVLNDVVDLLSVTYILSERIPQSISQIDTGNINTYELTLDEVCLLVKHLKVTYQNIELGDTLKDILGLLINQLSFVCCSGEKLAILLDEIENRKTEILTQIQLSEFVKKHPGLRHQAGVIPGGTFIMAYLTENAADKSTYQPVRMELNFLEQPNIDDDGTDGDEGIIQLWDDRISTRFAFLHKVTNGTQNPRNEIVMIGDSIEETVSNLAEFLNNIWQVAGFSNKCQATTDKEKLIIEIIDQRVRRKEHFIQFYNPAIVETNNKIFFDENEIIARNVTLKNRVIADFSLPYMCCSDCAPINFIVPKEPITLSLPVSHICLDDTTIPIPFTVTPADGEIKAVVEEGISGGITQNEEGAYFFDASLLDPSLYGTEISFTVNDEETTTVITVYQTPQPIILPLTEDFIYNDTRTEVEVFFDVSGTGINASTEFAWDFGDNTPIDSQRPNSDHIISHIYTLPIEPNNTAFPRVSVTNGLCTNDIILEGIVFQDLIEPSLTIQGSYCLDTQRESNVEIPFTNISPENGLIEIVGGDEDGIFINQDARSLVIIPGVFNRFNEPIAFTISSLPTTAQITIFRMPQVSIVHDEGSFFWEDGILKQNYFFDVEFLDEIDPSSLTYEWLINEDTVSTERSFTHQFIMTDENFDRSFHVELFVNSASGCGVRETVPITIVYPSFSLALPRESFCTRDEESYPITFSPALSGTEIIGPGVSQNDDDSYVFTPIATEITTSQEINLNIVGITEPLTVFLDSGPAVNFTVVITPEGRLLIENTSDIGAAPYVWNIAGQEIVRQNRAGFDLDVNSFEESVIDISLTVHGQCGPNTLIRENITIRGDIEFALELPGGNRDYCNTDDTAYPITIIPNIPGTEVEGDGVDQNSDGSFVFIPVNTGITSSGPVDIRVVDHDTVLTVQIHEPPTINIAQEPSNLQITRPQNTLDVTFTASPNIPGATYTWTFGDGAILIGDSVPKTFTISNDIEEVFSTSVTLEVSGTICTIEPISRPIDIEINLPNFTIEIDEGNRDFCIEDEEWYLITITPDIPETVVEGNGVFPNESDQYFFRPNSPGVTPGPVQITINDVVLATVQVHEQPTITVAQVPNNLQITRPQNTQEVTLTASPNIPGATYTWDFGDETSDTGVSVLKEFTVPNEFEGDFPISVILNVSETICDFPTITDSVIITVITPSFELDLNNGNLDFCDDDDFPYPITITPDNIPGTTVQGLGIRSDGNGGFVFRPDLAGTGSKNISIGEAILLTANVIPHPVANFTFNPPNPGVTVSNRSRTITFTASGASSIINNFPDAQFIWKFIDVNTQETIDEREGVSVNPTFTVPLNVQGSYNITAILNIEGTLCDPNPEPKPVVITISPDPDTGEPRSCNEIVDEAIIADGDSIKDDPVSSGEIGQSIVRPTKSLYGTVIGKINMFISGGNNDQLNGLFFPLIETTANTLLQFEEQQEVQFLTKYLKVQIKLLFHILHCQKDISDSDKSVIESTIDQIEIALNNLKDKLFDIAPNPEKPDEGTLRQFLIDCQNGEEIADFVKDRITSLIDLIRVD
ncbi:hypothetical protein [Dokdonia sp.]|uniref:PKD domain-containing protein n=1 Tax=Dokdonia sp. TaxID=2024995 RepID=UPI0032656257